MSHNGVTNSDTSIWSEINIVVDAIEYIVQGGETTVYIRDIDGNVYQSAFDERFLFIKSDDTLSLQVIDDTGVIKTVIYSNLVETEDVETESFETVEGAEVE